MSSRVGFPIVTAETGVTDTSYPVGNVRRYGALALSGVDDTPAILRAFDAIVAMGGGVVEFPGGTYCIKGAPTLTNASNVTVVGNGAILQLTATATFGIQLAGVSTNVVVDGIRVIGTNSVPEADDGGATGIGSLRASAGGTATGTAVRIRNCYVEKTARGILFDGLTMASWTDVTIDANEVTDILGTRSGTGYGIGCASGTGYRVTKNRLARCQRHSTYVSIARDVVLANNRYLDHRAGVSTNTQTSACEIARSGFVVVNANIFDNCADGAISIEPHESDSSAETAGFQITSNIIRNSPLIDIFIGGQGNPSSSGVSTLADVTIAGNYIKRPPGATNTSVPIYVYHVDGLLVSNNTIRAENAFTSQFCAIYLQGNGGASYTKNVLICSNRSRTTSAVTGATYFLEVSAAVATGTESISVAQNSHVFSGGGGGLIVFDVPLTNTKFITEALGGSLINDPVSSTLAGQAAYLASHTTFAAAGTNGPVPSAVVGYLNISIDGTIYKLPYFNS
ncbi:MAG: hypothetical protein JWM95_3344 [Gemmatimonadetes bacterium]|nr:hypothetical protein [Gemmatimonadota bacterium]